MKSTQELVHWLEQGAGARWVRRLVLVLAGLLLTVVYSWRQFHGIPNEFVMQQAVLGRQLAQGEGFTTQVNYPQTFAVLAARGHRFDEGIPYPELHHAPLYALVMAGVFKLLPESAWAHRPAPPDGWAPDYVLLGLNAVLFWVAVWLAWRLARKLFDHRAAWLAAFGTAVSVSLWEQVVALSGLTLFLGLILGVFNVLAGIEERLGGSSAWSRMLGLRVALLGLLGGMLFLTEYSGGLVMVTLTAYLAWRTGGR